jgi:hypothetical protein
VSESALRIQFLNVIEDFAAAPAIAALDQPCQRPPQAVAGRGN